MQPPLSTGDFGSEERAESVFVGALRIGVGERDTFLDRECGSDSLLRAKVEGLLRDHDEAGSFLDGNGFYPELQTVRARLQPEQAGVQFGPYKLLEQIGEGGFGAVWVAEQERPVRRRVALKIIKPGMDTKEVIARFEQERQALAMMDHPNIAKVFDAGATPHGRPYFVMELVRGTRITEYCDQARLPTAERLRLFIAVCHAVQHAHQKGIIHRDLKPSNILVTLHDGVPVPMVIDFGVAKATQQQRLTDLTVYTQFEQMVGTPLYMSPEQAEMSGIDIDTRSDIYSLGVLLYELLAGRTPFDPETLMQRGLDEIRRVVREEEPPKPSTFVSTLALDRRTHLAQHRQTDGAKLVGLIRGDLDWIVMKALEKDRTRRYETASGLAQDLLRHLASEPVQARPPTRLYRFRRFARRNKFALGAGTAVLVALLIGLGVSTWMFLQEKDARQRAVAAEKQQSHLRELAVAAELAQSQEREKAEAEATKSTQVAHFLKDMLEGVGPSVALGRDTTMLREILEKTAERVGTDLVGHPEVEAELRNIIGEVYRALGDAEKARSMHGEALEIRKTVFGNEHPAVAESLHGLATAHVGEESEPLHREALEMRTKLLGAEHPDVATSLVGLAFSVRGQGRYGEAETIARQALAMRRKLLGSDAPEVAETLLALAQAVGHQGRYVESGDLHKEGLEILRAALGGEHFAVAETLLNLAQNFHAQNRMDEAETHYREALAMQKKMLGNDHVKVSVTLFQFAELLRGQGKHKEAEVAFREVLKINKKLLGDEHIGVATCLGNVALVLSEQGKLAEAETMHREALEMKRKLMGDGHSSVRWSLIKLGATLMLQHKLTEAEGVYREALAISRNLHGVDYGELAASLAILADMFYKQDKLEKTEAILREALAITKKLSGEENPEVVEILYQLGVGFHEQDKQKEAEAAFREVLRSRRKRLGDAHAQVARIIHQIAFTLSQQDKLKEAEAMFREALAMTKKLSGEESPEVANLLGNLAVTLNPQGKWAEAEAMHREALAIQRKLLGSPHQDVARSLHNLAIVSANQDEWAKAETQFREALAIYRKLGGSEDPQIPMLLVQLSSVLMRQGKDEEARESLKTGLATIRNAAPEDPALLDSTLEYIADSFYRSGQFAEAEPFYREYVEARQSRLPADDEKVLSGFASLARLMADWVWAEHETEGGNPRAKLLERARESERLLRDVIATRLGMVSAKPWRIDEDRSRLGGALIAVALTRPSLDHGGRAEDLTEAKSLLSNANAVLQAAPDTDKKYKRDSLTRLARLYEAWDKPDEAAEWKQKLADFDTAEAQAGRETAAAPAEP